MIMCGVFLSYISVIGKVQNAKTISIVFLVYALKAMMYIIRNV